RAAGQDGGHEVALEAQELGWGDRVDTSVDPMQTAELTPSLDCPRAEAQIAQLLQRDHPVLRPRLSRYISMPSVKASIVVAFSCTIAHATDGGRERVTC